MGKKHGIGAALAFGTAALLASGCASAGRAPAGQPAPRPEDERVEHGYGTTSRRNLTTAVGSLQITREEAASYTNLAQLLDGRIAGVRVWRTGIGDYTVQIRGQGEALVVVDGMTPPIGMSPAVLLSLINPSDVERVDVLKDASSSIYGVRGGNGVLLITTRRGGRQ